MFPKILRFDQKVPRLEPQCNPPHLFFLEEPVKRICYIATYQTLVSKHLVQASCIYSQLRSDLFDLGHATASTLVMLVIGALPILQSLVDRQRHRCNTLLTLAGLGALWRLFLYLLALRLWRSGVGSDTLAGFFTLDPPFPSSSSSSSSIY